MAILIFPFFSCNGCQIQVTTKLASLRWRKDKKNSTHNSPILHLIPSSYIFICRYDNVIASSFHSVGRTAMMGDSIEKNKNIANLLNELERCIQPKSNVSYHVYSCLDMSRPVCAHLLLKKNCGQNHLTWPYLPDLSFPIFPYACNVFFIRSSSIFIGPSGVAVLGFFHLLSIRHGVMP